MHERLKEMRGGPRRWCLLALAGVAATLGGGCSARMLKPMGSLPLHAMTLPHSSASARGASARDTRHKWYVRSNGRTWRHIVMHHSASRGGNAAVFDKYHRTQRGWDELGYHFVITNGHGGPDGKVEVGPRWTKQKQGAHTGRTPGNEYNEQGIGICLVGDFTTHLPTRAQLASLNELLIYLMETQCLGPDSVIGHCNAPSACTACPGNTFGRYVHQTLRPTLRRTRKTRTAMAVGRQ